LLSGLFAYRTEPDWSKGHYKPKNDTAEAKAETWAEFKEDRAKWNLLYSAAGSAPRKADANDLADDPAEWERINALLTAAAQVKSEKPEDREKAKELLQAHHAVLAADGDLRQFDLDGRVVRVTEK